LEDVKEIEQAFRRTRTYAGKVRRRAAESHPHGKGNPDDLEYHGDVVRDEARQENRNTWRNAATRFARHAWILAPVREQLEMAEEKFPPASATVWLIGLLLTVVEIGISIWARLTLAANWSGVVALKQDHELIRSGL
jgi:protein-S-isoprenylcysteine O-methyltransferase Ste14